MYLPNKFLRCYSATNDEKLRRITNVNVLIVFWIRNANNLFMEKQWANNKYIGLPCRSTNTQKCEVSVMNLNKRVFMCTQYELNVKNDMNDSGRRRRIGQYQHYNTLQMIPSYIHALSHTHWTGNWMETTKPDKKRAKIQYTHTHAQHSTLHCHWMRTQSVWCEIVWPMRASVCTIRVECVCTCIVRCVRVCTVAICKTWGVKKSKLVDRVCRYANLSYFQCTLITQEEE